jgi:hypothetical protein
MARWRLFKARAYIPRDLGFPLDGLDHRDAEIDPNPTGRVADPAAIGARKAP